MENTARDLKPSFAEARRAYLGGTDAAAILGLSRYRSPVQVWGEKTGLIQPENIDNKLPVILGKRLEEVVAELFTEKTGKKVRRVNETLFHPKYPFLGANIDRQVVGEDAGLECKTVGAWKAKEFEAEELPAEHIVQCVHYLAVTGKARWYLAALIGNQDFIIKTIERDEPMIRQLVEKEVAFWNNFVVPNIMPAIITANDDETLLKLFPHATQGPAIHLDDNANRIIETLQAYKLDRKNLEDQIAKMENELKAVLGSHDCGASARWLVTWKDRIAKRIDTELLRNRYPQIATEVEKETQTRILKIKGMEVI